MALAYKRHGINKTAFDIEELLLSKEYLKDLYPIYLNIPTKYKAKYKRDIASIIRKEILNEDFMRALARDVISLKQDSTGKVLYDYHIETNVFKYLRTKLYQGKSRLLLGDLMEYIK